MDKVKELWGKTAGYKTVGSGIVLLVWEAFTMIFPHAIASDWEQWGTKLISFGVGVGIFDQIFRGEGKLGVFFHTIISKFKKK